MPEPRTTRHMAQRTCRICRRRRPKVELLRWVWANGTEDRAAPNGGWLGDPDQRASGRGVYTCPGLCASKIDKVNNKPVRRKR